MVIKNSDTASSMLFPFRGVRVVKVVENGASGGVAYDVNGKRVTFTTPKGTTPDFSKEHVWDILLKSMKTL